MCVYFNLCKTDYVSNVNGSEDIQTWLLKKEHNSKNRKIVTQNRINTRWNLKRINRLWHLKCKPLQGLKDIPTIYYQHGTLRERLKASPCLINSHCHMKLMVSVLCNVNHTLHAQILTVNGLSFPLTRCKDYSHGKIIDLVQKA